MLGKIGLLALLLAGCWTASAGTIYIPASADSVYVVLNTPPPVNGHQLVGAPGDTVGWGFEVFNNSSDYLVFTGSFLTESAYLGPLGTSTGYTDYMGLNGGNDVFFMDPNSTWSASFNPGTPANPGPLTGIGGYLIDPGTPPTSEDLGTLNINYDAYTCDPSACSSYNAGQTLYLSDKTLPTFDIFVQQSQSVPEPSTALPFVLLAAGWASVRLRRRFAK